MTRTPPMSSVTLALYLGGIQLLLRQWEHFHNLLRQMPPQTRESFVSIFAHLHGVAAATAAPGPVAEVWQLTDTILRQWMDRYVAAARQQSQTIGDFQKDMQRINQAIGQAVISLNSQS